MSPKMLAGRYIAAVLVLLSALSSALAYDASKAPRYASPDMFRPNVDSIIVRGRNSQGPVDGMNVTPTLRGAPYFLSEILKRRLHALDYCSLAERLDITSYTGALNAAPCLQAAIDDAKVQGKKLEVDAGFWNLKTRVTVSGTGQTLDGEGWGELPMFDGAGNAIRSTKGTIINFDYLASADPYGVYVTGSHATIRNLEFRQTQPNPGPGWQPNVGPWAIYAYTTPYADAGGHRLAVDNVMLRNVYDGINTGITRGGTFTNIYGQPFHRGIRMEANMDAPQVLNAHFGWTYWSGQADVMAWGHANLVALDLQRVDNPYVSNFFTFNAAVGLQCSQRTDSYAPGNCNLLTVTNMGHDAVSIGVLIKDGGVLNAANYYCYADSALPQSACLKSVQEVANDFYDPARIQITGGDFNGAGTSALQFAWAPTQSKATVHQLTNVRIRGFDAANAGNAAISAAKNVTVQKSNLVVEGVTDPARIFSGAGQMIIPGNGSIGAAGWTELTNGLIRQWGKNAPAAGATSTQVTFPRACSATAFSVHVDQEYTAPANAAEVAMVSNVTATGFTVYSRYISGGTVAPAGEAFFWTALCQQ